MSDFPTKCARSVGFFMYVCIYLFMIFGLLQRRPLCHFINIFKRSNELNLVQRWTVTFKSLYIYKKKFLWLVQSYTYGLWVCVHAENPVLKWWRVNILIFTAWTELVAGSLIRFLFCWNFLELASAHCPVSAVLDWFFPCFDRIHVYIIVLPCAVKHNWIYSAMKILKEHRERERTFLSWQYSSVYLKMQHSCSYKHLCTCKQWNEYGELDW